MNLEYVNNEINKMRTLLEHKRGVVISEQSTAIPIELKDTNGVENFQTWMDTNKGAWAKAENGSMMKIDKDPKNGFGNYGPQTQKAWTQFKDEYLKSTTNNSQQATAKTNVPQVPKGYVFNI